MKNVIIHIVGKQANGKHKGKKFEYIEYKDGTFKYIEHR